jgi:methylase of polypeptide subunit release factors
MKLKKIKVNNEFFNIYFKRGVFLPTATTDFLIKGFLKNKSKLKKKKILDLGCGSGIVSIIFFMLQI